MTAELRRVYSAREFNRLPGTVARAAHQFGSVIVTRRGQESLLVMDAPAARSAGILGTPPKRPLFNLLEADADPDAWGEPPRAQIFLQIPEEGS
jgi:hypothetical protein